MIGAEYTEAIIPSIILIYGPFFKSYFNITFGRAIFLFRPPTSRFKLTLVATIILFLSLTVFGYIWGLIGIAIANIVSGIGTGLYAYYVVNKNIFKIDLRFKQFLSVFFICSFMVAPIYYTQLVWGYNIIALLGAYLTGITLFIITIHFTISDKFYALINTLSPIKIPDPIKLFYS